MAKFVIPLCIFLLALIHTGYALKCYACESKFKTECNDPFMKEKIPLNECQSLNMEASCMKLTTEDNGAQQIKRYCLTYPKNYKPCDYASSQVKTGHVKECEACTEDGCNAAGSISVSTSAIIATCLFAIINLIIKT